MSIEISREALVNPINQALITDRVTAPEIFSVTNEDLARDFGWTWRENKDVCPGVIREEFFNFDQGTGRLTIRVVDPHDSKGHCLLDVDNSVNALVDNGSIKPESGDPLIAEFIVGNEKQDIYSLNGLGQTRADYAATFDTKVCDSEIFEICLDIEGNQDSIEVESLISEIEKNLVFIERNPGAEQEVIWAGVEMFLLSLPPGIALGSLTFWLWRREERKAARNSEVESHNKAVEQAIKELENQKK